MCAAHPLLPTGLSDNAHTQSVKLYCGKCEDLYNPKSSRHANIDGAYFGTSFQNILFQVYPALIPEKTIRRYEPKVFGFKVHAAAALERWQSARREEMQTRLKEVGFGAVFKEDTESAGEDVMEEEEDDVEGGDGLAEWWTEQSERFDLDCWQFCRAVEQGSWSYGGYEWNLVYNHHSRAFILLFKHERDQ